MIYVFATELGKNKGFNSSYSPYLCGLILFWVYTAS